MSMVTFKPTGTSTLNSFLNNQYGKSLTKQGQQDIQARQEVNARLGSIKNLDREIVLRQEYLAGLNAPIPNPSGITPDNSTPVVLADMTLVESNLPVAANIEDSITTVFSNMSNEASAAISNPANSKAIMYIIAILFIIFLIRR